jgi:hypothetical protein
MRRRVDVLARGADLPTRGQVRGVITIVQEDRFRLEDEQGRGYLFTLGRGAGPGVRDLYLWCDRKVPIDVDYKGPPDMGGVAIRIRPA